MNNDAKKIIARCVEIFGTRHRFAAQLDRHPSTLTKWVSKDNKIPARYHALIEKITKGEVKITRGDANDV